MRVYSNATVSTVLWTNFTFLKDRRRKIILNFSVTSLLFSHRCGWSLCGVKTSLDAMQVSIRHWYFFSKILSGSLTQFVRGSRWKQLFCWWACWGRPGSYLQTIRVVECGHLVALGKNMKIDGKVTRWGSSGLSVHVTSFHVHLDDPSSQMLTGLALVCSLDFFGSTWW